MSCRRVSQSQCRGCVCAPCAIMVVNNLVTRKNCIQTSWCFPYFSLYPKRAVLELYALQHAQHVCVWLVIVLGATPLILPFHAIWVSSRVYRVYNKAYGTF